MIIERYYDSKTHRPLGCNRVNYLLKQELLEDGVHDNECFEAHEMEPGRQQQNGANGV